MSYLTAAERRRPLLNGHVEEEEEEEEEKEEEEEEEEEEAREPPLRLKRSLSGLIRHETRESLYSETSWASPKQPQTDSH